MNYNISIEFTKNNKKAGKLTLKDEQGNILLKNAAVAVPLSSPISFNKSELYVENFDSALNNVTSSYIDKVEDKPLHDYQDALKICLAEDIKKTINNINGEPLFICNEKKLDNELCADSRLFVVHKETFDILLKIIEQNKVSMSGERVTFLLGTEQLSNTTTSYLDNIKKVQILGKELEKGITSNNEVNKIIENNTREKEHKEKPIHNNFSIASKLLQADKEVIKNNVLVTEKMQNEFVESNRSNTSSESKFYPNTEKTKESQHHGWKSDEGLSEFDVYFMQNNPHLATLYKPNSLLAWMTHFGTDTSAISKQNVMDNIHSIKGFENVGNSEFKYTSQGYSVDLYEDEQRQKLLGTLSYENNDCKMISPTGIQTCLHQDNTNHWTGYSSTETGSAISYDLSATNQGYTTSWQSQDTYGQQYGSTYNTDNNLNNIDYHSANNASTTTATPTTDWNTTSSNNSWQDTSNNNSNTNWGPPDTYNQPTTGYDYTSNNGFNP